MDRLSLLLTRYALRAGVFHAGSLCGLHEFEADAQRGHIHLVRQGPVRLIDAQGVATLIDEPTLLFLPRPEQHRLVADDRIGAEVLCATVQFGGGGANPISDSLPSAVQVRLADMPAADALLGLMAEESLGSPSGRQAALDRLCELLMIHLLRHCLERGLTQGGALAGLADPRLGKALAAIHAEPARAWTLDTMAATAGMSRARFALRFREVTGETPADYLAGWRVSTAQALLRSGRPLQQAGLDVGYASTSAFTRAFVRKVGMPPGRWLKAQLATVDG